NDPTNHSRAHIWYVYAPTVGSGHTFTCSTGSATYPAITVAAFAGAASSPFDVENGNGTQNTTASTGSITPTQDNDLIITIGANQTGTFTEDSGVTESDEVSYGAGNNIGG